MARCDFTEGFSAASLSPGIAVSCMRMQHFLKAIRFLASLPIRVYRLVISPLFPPSCIYTPTCSEYAVRSIMRHGVLKGSALSVGRITRCIGAFFEGGEDPVPESFSFRTIAANYRRYRRKKAVDDS